MSNKAHALRSECPSIIVINLQVIMTHVSQAIKPSKADVTATATTN